MSELLEVAKIGLCHHGLYPCKDDPEYHVETLERVLARPDLEVVDLTIPYGDRYRYKAIDMIRESGKTIVYNGYLMPTPKMPLCTLSPTERAQILMLAKDQADVAQAAGVAHFMQSVGGDPGPERRAAAYDALEEYIAELGSYLRKIGGMHFLIELMDRSTDKKSLCGPTEEVVEFVKRVAVHTPNVGIVVDVSHIPLMQESFAHTIETSRDWTRHVHLGNCLMKDRSHPWWGDQHPPLGWEGTEVGLPEVREVLSLFKGTGYIGAGERGTISLEIRCHPELTPEQTIDQNVALVQEAWRQLSDEG